METDKFEKHIQSKLKEREIEPSVMAWSKVSEQLNTVQESKKPVYLWVGMAASIVVLIAVSFFYFNTTEKAISNTPIIVDVEVEPIVKEKEVSITKEEKVIEIIEDKTVEFVVEEKMIIDLKGDSKVKKEKITSDISSKRDANTSLIAEVDEDIINDKVEEVLARVNFMELSDEVTDAEVDSLLQKAQQDILRERIFKTDASVDAMALLTEVEDELDQSFRDQIFNSLKSGFIKVRTAVADRNN